MKIRLILSLLLLVAFNNAFSQADNQVPELISIKISPDTVNTIASSATFTIKVVAKDNSSGLKNGGIWYKSPSGSVNQSASLTFKGLLQDTAIVEVSLPQFSEAGIWKISSLYFYDNANNLKSMSGPFSTFGKDSIVVLSITDNTPPELISINIIQDTINTKSSSANFTIKVIAKDDISGVKFAGIWYRSPSGLVNQSTSLNFNGKVRDTASINVTLPVYSEAGTWKISSIYFYDKANNFINYNNPLSSFGKDSVIVVSVTDNVAPELISLNISPDTINTKNSPSTFLIKIIARDNLSGLKFGGIWYKSPSGFVNQSASLNFKGLLQDTALVLVTLPQASEIGTWKISSMYFYDNADNLKSFSSPFSSFGKDSVIVNYNAEVKNGAAFLIKDAFNVKAKSADVVSLMGIAGNAGSYHDIRWQYQKGDVLGSTPMEQNVLTVDGAVSISNVNAGGNFVNLSPSSKYTYRIISKNKNGNIQSYSDLKQFTTLANSAPLAYDTTFSIKDSISINGKVGKIRNFDADADVLTFKIKSGNTNETFKLDSLGNVYVKNKINYDLSNKYDLVVSVSDGFDSTTSKVTINIAPIPAFYYTGNFGVCTGDSLKVTTNKYAGYSILWYKNGTLFNSANTDTVYLKDATNYQIKIVKGQDTIVSELKTLTVSAVPVAPVVANPVLCQTATPVILTATVTSGNTLLWYGNNATGGTASTTVPKTNAASTIVEYYYVSQKNNTSACESSRTKITINPMVLSPIVNDTSFCQNVTNAVLSATASSGNNLFWYGTSATGGVGTTNAYIPNVSSTGISSYYVSQKSTATGCESARAKIAVTIKSIPQVPVISRDSVGNLISSNAYGNSWYKEGAVTGDTLQKIKPSTVGLYTVKTSLNNCSSALSNGYYYLVTDLINLSASEFIKVAPNPFSSQINVDFVVKGYQFVNIEVYEISTGVKVATRQAVGAGSAINLSQLASGTYVIKVSSNDLKLNYTFKLLKL